MQGQYRNYAPAQVSQRSPHAQAPPRRGGIGPMVSMSSGPHPQATLSGAQMAQQQQAQVQALEAAKRRSQKPTDKNIPDGVEDTVIDPEIVHRYKALREVERKLDATMTRKRLDMVDSVNRSSKVSKTMRIWISNTVEDQVWQGNGLNVDAFDFAPNMDASFRVRIQGRLLDDESEELEQDKKPGEAAEAGETVETAKQTEAPKPPSHTAPKQRFSHFLKSLYVEFDSSRFRNGSEMNVDWKRPETGVKGHNPPAAADFDELTFKRTGDENTNITIKLLRNESPERWKLSPELAEVVDMKEASQHEAVMGLWEYIRLSGLQEDEEKRNFRCDDLLKKVVRQDVGHVPLLNEYVGRHISPVDPITLQYTIRVDEEFHKDPKPTIYDIQVQVEDPLQNSLQPLLNHPSYTAMLSQVKTLDDELAQVVQAIAVSKAKHTFFTSLSEDPANFVRNWISSQKRDLDVVLGDQVMMNNEAMNAPEWRKGGDNSVWTTDNARESVNVLLSKQRS